MHALKQMQDKVVAENEGHSLVMWSTCIIIVILEFLKTKSKHCLIRAIMCTMRQA